MLANRNEDDAEQPESASASPVIPRDEPAKAALDLQP